MITGATCYWDSSVTMTVCWGGRFPTGYGVATTFGHTTVVAWGADPDVAINPSDLWGDNYGVRMEHEANHASQWDVLGTAEFAALYGLAAWGDSARTAPGRSQGCTNVFEWSAGLAAGGYQC